MGDVLTALEVTHLTKAIGDQTILSDISFEVSAGSILAVVGPPDSGKTTLARILATADAPTRGVVRILGKHARRRVLEAREMLGYMPSVGGLDGDLTVGEYLEFFLRAYDRDDATGFTTMAEVLELADLGERTKDPVPSLTPSEGRKLGLARCLLHDPRVLILDEPLADLDEAGREDVAAVIGELPRLGKAVVVCTRSVRAFRDSASQFCLLDAGVACEVAETADIMRYYRPEHLYELRYRGDTATANRLVDSSKALLLMRTKDGFRLSVETPDVATVLEARLKDAGMRTQLRPLEAGFDDAVAVCFARRAALRQDAERFAQEIPT